MRVKLVADSVDVAFPTANRLVARFEELGILRELTGHKRGRIFRYEPYLALFENPVPTHQQATLAEVNETP